jgi:aminobenzoyl-glutamate utilization protein B
MWVDCAQSGMPSMIDPAIFAAAKTIGTSMIELLTDPSVLKQAQDEFEERTGGGIGGSKWVAPLLPPDHKAPVDLKWPEYVTTERGRDWYIPKPL